jgi:hypothetical protein
MYFVPMNNCTSTQIQRYKCTLISRKEGSFSEINCSDSSSCSIEGPIMKIFATYKYGTFWALFLPKKTFLYAVGSSADSAPLVELPGAPAPSPLPSLSFTPGVAPAFSPLPLLPDIPGVAPAPCPLSTRQPVQV